ncbi:MaoC family dehydratase [Streptomyces pharetrae]|uniref:MaoC family dehydratase n=1 Tax=Streptomyces pharetrae TaxID=291370 RepID=UPI0036498713
MPTLAGSLTRGALLSPFKRPRPDAGFPRTPLTLHRVRVDLARLAAYERVCGFPTGDDALPPTYPHILGFPPAMRLMSARAFPLPLLGLVHTSFDLTRYTALPATGEYALAVRVEGLAPHRRGTEATVLTVLRADGDVVWESRSTYLARHRTRHTPAGTPAPPEDTPGDTALPALAEWRLGSDLGRRYAAASGDRNPIHLHPLTARVFGFPRPIAHGMWSVARCLAAHGTPDAVRVRARFLAPVPLPGTVEFAAHGGRFALRGAGRTHLTGTVDALGAATRSRPR